MNYHPDDRRGFTPGFKRDTQKARLSPLSRFSADRKWRARTLGAVSRFTLRDCRLQAIQAFSLRRGTVGGSSASLAVRRSMNDRACAARHFAHRVAPALVSASPQAHDPSETVEVSCIDVYHTHRNTHYKDSDVIKAMTKPAPRKRQGTCKAFRVAKLQENGTGARKNADREPSEPNRKSRCARDVSVELRKLALEPLCPSLERRNSFPIFTSSRQSGTIRRS